MTDAQLLPCPFCGGGASIMQGTLARSITIWSVDCTGEYCHARPRVYDKTKSDAITAWNTRADLIQPMIDAAVAAALERAADACTNIIQNIEILKADGETYQPMWVLKVARGLVDIARQDILALIPKGDSHE